MARLCLSMSLCIYLNRGDARGVTGQCKVGAARMQLMLRSRGGLAVEQA